MNFSQGHSETKVQCDSCLFSQGKTPEFTKMGEIHELFVLALSLVWFAGATLDPRDWVGLELPLSLPRPEKIKNVRDVRQVMEGFGERLRGNRNRGNRPERFWEGNLPLRGSLRGSLRGRVSEVFRGFQRFFRAFQSFSEVFRGFLRFSEVFQSPSQRPSQSAIFLSEFRVLLPLVIVLLLKTPTKAKPSKDYLP